MQKAVKAAKEAFPKWSSLSAEKRLGYLMAISLKIEEQLDELALAETKDNGKPLWLSKAVDIPRADSNCKVYATEMRQDKTDCFEMGDEALNYTLRKPIGIAGCISPWNLPLYLFTWKIAPALASGNCLVAKP